MTSEEMLDKREDVLEEFDDKVDPSHGPLTMTLGELRWFTAQLLADEVVRLRQERDDLREMVNATQWGETVASAELEHIRRILAALREPSDMVVDALREYVLDLSRFDDALKAIQVAVAAAEADASHGARATKEVCDA